MKRHKLQYPAGSLDQHMATDINPFKRLEPRPGSIEYIRKKLLDFLAPKFPCRQADAVDNNQGNISIRSLIKVRAGNLLRARILVLFYCGVGINCQTSFMAIWWLAGLSPASIRRDHIIPLE